MHTYEGVVQDGVYVLLTDGVPEQVKPPLNGFHWGPGGGHATYMTASYILARETVVPQTGRYVLRLAEEILAVLPTNKPWRLTSEDLTRFMQEE